MFKLLKSSLILTKYRAFGHCLLLGLVISSCQSDSTKDSNSRASRTYYELMLNDKESVKVQLAISNDDQVQGLSGLRPEQLKDDHGMLFFYTSMGPRSFWMPDTYMDLDLFYLDDKFRVTEIYRGLKHHPGRQEPPAIPRAPTVYSWHVLELKSSSPWSKKIRQFQQLNWKAGQNLPKILRDTLPQK